MGTLVFGDFLNQAPARAAGRPPLRIWPIPAAQVEVADPDALETLTQLRSLKLSGMADALQAQMAQPSMSALSFEERLGLLVQQESASRDDRRRTRLLSLAHLKYPQATIEDIDTRTGRGIERSQIASLTLGDWIKTGHTVIITGATGSGKT